MNTPLPQIKEATKVASLPWHVVVVPFMDRWEPLIVNGRPLAFNSPGLARAAASGHPGATDIAMGVSPLPPSVERIREVANPERLPVAPISFDIEAMDGNKLGQPIRSAFQAWRA